MSEANHTFGKLILDHYNVNIDSWLSKIADSIISSLFLKNFMKEICDNSKDKLRLIINKLRFKYL